jgi:CspA family cold shock protein
MAVAAGSQRETGVVKWFNAQKGFGFITAQDGTDVFVHWTGIQASGKGGQRIVSQGQQVSFVRVRGYKGPEADGVAAAGASLPNSRAKTNTARH